jgi:hypothetical protein
VTDRDDARLERRRSKDRLDHVSPELVALLSPRRRPRRRRQGPAVKVVHIKPFVARVELEPVRHPAPQHGCLRCEHRNS